MPQKKDSKFMMWCAKVQEKHWIINLVLVRLSLLWYSLILAYLGEELKLIKLTETGKKLTVLAWAITIGLTVVVTLSELSKLYADRRRVYPPEVSGYALLNTLRGSIENVCESKYNTLVAKIHAVKTERKESAPIIISNPPKQLQGIANEITQCLLYLLRDDETRWRAGDLYVSIAYQFPLESEDWHWATEEHGLRFDELLKSPGPDENGNDILSTFLYLLRGNRDNAFYISKEKAKDEGHYIPDDLDQRDGKGQLLGSIACYKGTIKKADVTYIRYILTITSYSKPFTTDSKVIDNLRYNMKNEVISDFSIRIAIELCLLYLSQLRADEEKRESGQQRGVHMEGLKRLDGLKQEEKEKQPRYAE